MSMPKNDNNDSPDSSRPLLPTSSFTSSMSRRVEEARESLLHAGEDASKRARRFWDGFTDFAFQDNVLEVAVGLIIAASFTAIVSSLTSDILLPLISLFPFLSRNLDEKFAVLKGGPKHNTTAAHGGYNTVHQALDDGAVVLAWGSFVDKVVRFFVIGVTLYVIARVYEWSSRDSIIKGTKKCRYCRKTINEKALRCVNCTSWQDGRED